MSGKIEKPKWLYTIIPFYAINSSAGSFIRLLILDLGGSVIDVSLAVSAYNIALIPSAYIGGRFADYLGKRKPILIFCSLGQLLSLIPLFFSTSIPVITILFATFSFFYSFAPPIFSLLLMETYPKESWGDGSAYSFRYMIYGSVTGLTLSVATLLFLPLRTMGFLPVLFSITTLILSLALTRDPQITLERRAIVFSPEAFINRLIQLPVIIFRIPRTLDFRHLIKELKHGLTRDVPIIMLVSTFFFLGANLFFTSYTPFLKLNNLSYFEIVGLDLFITVINGLASSNPFKEISKRGDPGVIVEFLTLRAIAFLFGAIASTYFTGRSILYVTILIYLLLGIAYTNFTIGLNALLYRCLPSGKHGSTLGVYSSLNSVAMFLGSILSGGVSFYFSYSLTFLLSSFFLLSAASFFEWHFKPRRYEEEVL
ncbi:MFS transporter [Candidatus Bathyarchaeota archaeon]|nr:MFS transporter [Candidatus Bathyarchaeota archaeon]